MIFDLFHSISDCEVGGKSLGPRKTIEQFFSQAKLADELETDLWPIVKRLVFLEATEIFIRLLRGDELASAQTEGQLIEVGEVERTFKEKASNILEKYRWPVRIKSRWDFETVKLVPQVPVNKALRLVLGSGDPEALTLANRWWDVDLFNLSFTPPDQIEKLHDKMLGLCEKWGNTWRRDRLPRTVLIFIDKDRRRARDLANRVIDTYIEAMRGTAQVPSKSTLLERALIGDASEIRDQLHPDNPRRFNKGDRLMLWFEFNQLDNEAIKERMRYFFREVAEKL